MSQKQCQRQRATQGVIMPRPGGDGRSMNISHGKAFHIGMNTVLGSCQRTRHFKFRHLLQCICIIRLHLYQSGCIYKPQERKTLKENSAVVFHGTYNIYNDLFLVIFIYITVSHSHMASATETGLKTFRNQSCLFP